MIETARVRVLMVLAGILAAGAAFFAGFNAGIHLGHEEGFRDGVAWWTEFESPRRAKHDAWRKP